MNVRTASKPPACKAAGGPPALVPGALAALGMASIYIVIVALAQGWRDAIPLFREDLLLTAPIILGFGTQVALYGRLRRLQRAGGAMVTASGGASAASMVACCAHRLADLLPVVGASAAASFLAAYKVAFLFVGVAMNATGIAIILRRTALLRKAIEGEFSAERAALSAVEESSGGGAMTKDPVCGMDVDEETAALKSVYDGVTYFFCSQGCKAAFDREPAKYAKTERGSRHTKHG